jgi:uncharacterized protein YoxC
MTQGALLSAIIALSTFLLGFIIAELRDIKKTLTEVQVSLSRIDTKLIHADTRFEEIKGGLDERIAAGVRRGARG